MSDQKTPAQIILLSPEMMLPFLEYCRNHRFEHDESFLSEDELSSYAGSGDVCFLAIDESRRILGALSVMKTGRIRIFHCVFEDEQIYAELQRAFDELRPPPVRNALKMFLPAERYQVIEIQRSLGYERQRVVIVMERPSGVIEIPEHRLQNLSNKGLKIRRAFLPEDTSEWTRIRNAAFSNLEGSEPKTDADFATMQNESWHLPELTLVAEIDGHAVGIIRAIRDEQGAFAFIGPLAVDPRFNNMGIGSALLGELVDRSCRLYGMSCSLSVNANNRDALKLYERAGFRVTEEVIALVRPAL